MKKRFLAGLTAVILMFVSVSLPGNGSIYAGAGSKAAKEDVQHEETAAGMQSDISVDGTGSFGNMLAKELSQKQQTQEENSGCNVFSIEVENGAAKVSFETVKDATLVVGIYDEAGVSMLMSASQEVKADQSEATIAIGENIPQYFYLKGFLTDSETLQPLCTAYGSPMYTKEMQDFFSKTTDDFEADRVLNLDQDKTNNFLVYSEKTIRITKKDGVNKVVSADDDKLKYVIENADENITSLNKGDIFSYEYTENDFLIVKVASIKTEGTKVTITGEDSSMEDVFEYVRIDTEAGLENATVDPSTCGEGVTYKGFVDKEEAGESTYKSSPKGDGVYEKELLEPAAENEIAHGELIKFNLAEAELGPDYANTELSGSITLGLTFTITVNISPSYQYLELKMENFSEISISISAELEADIPLGKVITVTSIPGITISLIPLFIVEVSGEIKASGTLKGELGFSLSNTEGFQMLPRKQEFTPEIKAEVSLFVGFGLSPKVALVSDYIASAELTAEAGVNITGSMASTLSSDEIHACKACIEGEIDCKIEIVANASFLNMEVEPKVLEWTGHICDFYYSFDYGEFHFTECPHRYYKTEIEVIDKNSNKGIEGAKIRGPFRVNKNGGVLTNVYNLELVSGGIIETGKDGKAAGYLIGDSYTFTVSADGYVLADGYSYMDTVFTIPYDGTIRLYLEPGDGSGEDSKDKPGGGSEKDSEDKPGDGSGENSTEKLKVQREDVKLALYNGESMGLGSHSGVITEDGSLYMWGSNSYGQLGDGTYTDRSSPVKVLDNVVSVKVGDLHSGALTKDGSLYMWGSNEYGQVGIGSEEYRIATPVKVLDNVACFDLGVRSSGALTEDGILYMWGRNRYGQLGDRTGEGKRSTPVEVLNNVVSVRLGDYHTGALTNDGSLYMWGYNFYGQLGNDVDKKHPNPVNFPVKVLDDVASFRLGGYYSGALKNDGSLYMWGSNERGEFGNDEGGYSKSPIKVLDGVASFDLVWEWNEYTDMGGRSGVVKEDGSLYMWGNNKYGQVGEEASNYCSSPVWVRGDVASVKLGELHSGALTKDGSLYMWGRNQNGQVGNNTCADCSTPTKVMDDVAFVSLGNFYSGAVKKDGSLYMWGMNSSGEIGNGTLIDCKTPTKINLPKKVAVDGASTMQSSLKQEAAVGTKQSSLKKEAMQKGDSLDKDTVKVSGSTQTANLSGLVPNETYNFYLLKSQPDERPLNQGNLLYLNQYKADSSGSLSFTYKARESCDTAVQLLVGKSRISLSKAKISVPDFEYTGGTWYAIPTVIYEEKVLKEGRDYKITKGGSAKEAGTYTLTITGIGTYKGRAGADYQVVPGSVKKGDMIWDSKSKSVYRVSSFTSRKKTLTLVKPQNKKIKSVIVPAVIQLGGVTYKVTSIGDGAFKKCTLLKKAVIGKNITKIGKQSFQGCKKLASITVKTKKLSGIGKNALKGIKPTAKIKVPSKKLASYKKLFRGKGQKKKVKITT